MRSTLFLAGFSLLLSACVSLLPSGPPAAGPPAASTGAPKQFRLTTMKGTTRTVTVSVPSDVCSPDDYLSGFQSQYVYTWNLELNAQVANATPAQRPALADARLKQPAPTIIPPPSASQQTAACTALAASKGQTAGAIQAHNDLVAASPTS